MKVNIRVSGIQQEKGRIIHLQMKGKQCKFIIQSLVVVFLHSYFYFHCLKLLFKVLLVPVRKYGQVRKQGNKSVALCFGFYSTQVRYDMIFQVCNQTFSCICDQSVINFEPFSLPTKYCRLLFSPLFRFSGTPVLLSFKKIHSNLLRLC